MIRFKKVFAGIVLAVACAVLIPLINMNTVNAAESGQGSGAAVNTYGGVDYSAVYDFSYYVGRYPDLMAVYGNNPSGALRHFVTYGMKEGRQAISTFNVTSYRYQYRDLRAAYGTNLKLYYLHYIRYGKKEGRKATGTTSLQNAVTVYNGVDYSAVYDYNYYINNYSDIKKAYGTNDDAVLKHFVTYGMKEGRQASSSFNVTIYKKNYSDLRNAFGTNLKSYYLHYIRYGKKEGRNATSLTATYWQITQYSDTTGSQANFYTITSNHGDLIVVDGGLTGNADYVKSIISQYGNVVDLWILTHPHFDHIGAFNELIRDSSITVKRIWDNGLDYDYYDANDESWDYISDYATYLQLTKNLSNVRHIKIGDVLSYDNLTFTFFHSYDASLQNVSCFKSDVGNNFSLMFKVSASNSSKSMLFVGDNHSAAVADYMISKYGTALKATYAQMGHHGNNSLSVDFYKYVSPKMVFFDAPAWLVNGESYDTKSNMDKISSAGISYVWYNTAPNTVNLY